MSNNDGDFVVGAGVTAVFVVVLVCVVAVTVALTRSGIAEDCKIISSTVIGGKAYSCELITNEGSQIGN
jgi:hypothetical protein